MTAEYSEKVQHLTDQNRSPEALSQARSKAFHGERTPLTQKLGTIELRARHEHDSSTAEDGNVSTPLRILTGCKRGTRRVRGLARGFTVGQAWNQQRVEAWEREG